MRRGARKSLTRGQTKRQKELSLRALEPLGHEHPATCPGTTSTAGVSTSLLYPTSPKLHNQENNMAERAKRQPETRLSEANITASIWKNKSSDGGHYYTVTVSRWYKKEGSESREFTSVLGLYDLPNASIVQMKAHNWIRRAIAKEEDLEDQEGTATGTDG